MRPKRMLLTGLLMAMLGAGVRHHTKRNVASIGFALLLGLIASSQVAASPRSTHGFAGVWTSIDCATWWEETPDGHLVDCDRWGDGSTFKLIIGGGTSPHVVLLDDYASDCADGNTPTQLVGVGAGAYIDVWLFVEPLTVRCGPARGAMSVSYYYDLGSDTLWEDEDGDGWGLVFRRAT